MSTHIDPATGQEVGCNEGTGAPWWKCVLGLALWVVVYGTVVLLPIYCLVRIFWWLCKLK